MIYSQDRGLSWQLSSIPDRDQQGPGMNEMTVVLSGAHAGRVVGVGTWGIATSDDGGASFQHVPGWWGYFRFQGDAVAVLRGAAPGGGDRLAMMMSDGQSTVNSSAVLVSDDGGDTWRKTFDLTGDPNNFGPSIVDAGGGRAFAVMDGGHVWLTEDAGETWRIVGIVPGALVDPAGSPTFGKVKWALRGPDGRLYVGGIRLGGVNPGWAFRTVAPVVVGEASPEAPERLGVSVRPNPAGGLVAVVLNVAEAGTARVVVVDARGREVAVVHDGAVVAGEQAFGVETGAWPTGVYVVRASVAGQTASARLVVAR